MAAPRHVLETYIRTTPERIWEAIVDPEFTTRYYFGTALSAPIETGAEYQYTIPDGPPAIRGTVEEADPPRRLVMTFAIQWDDRAREETPSRVTWEITPVLDDPPVCRLTLVHGDLGMSPRTWELTVTGWPVIVAGLKTLLETGLDLGEVPDVDGSPLLGPDTDAERTWHRALAAAANNGVYPLLDERRERGPDPDLDDRIVHQAHAAAHHWRIAGGPEQHALAEYLCSRAHACVGRPESALHHAERCAAMIADLGLGDWQLAYALEARARALACAGRTDEAAAVLAEAVAVPIADADDAAILRADLVTEPWYGVEVPLLP